MIPTTGVTRGRPNPLHWKFVERLRRLRKAAGLSVSRLALQAGLSKNTGATLEDGPGSPRVSTVVSLSRVLGCSPGWLAFGLGEVALPDEQGPLGCEGMAERAREAREALGLSMREVSRRAKTAFGTIRSIEHGGMPSLDLAEQVAVALQISPAWMCFFEGPRELPKRGSKTAPAASAPAP